MKTSMNLEVTGLLLTFPGNRGVQSERSREKEE